MSYDRFTLCFDVPFHFGFRALKDLMDEFNLGADCMVSKLLSLADGETTVSLLDIVNRTALDVIGRVGD